MRAFSPVQCKMARAALGWGIRDLAHLAKMSPDTVARLERGNPLKDRTHADLRAIFEAAGIEFLDDNGVRLKTTPETSPGGSIPGAAQKPASARADVSIIDTRTRKRRTAPRAKKPTASDRKASVASSKEAQIGALREHGA